MPLTKRDKKFYDYLVRTRLPIWSTDAAKMFYPSETGNERSSLTICLNVLPANFLISLLVYDGS